MNNHRSMERRTDKDSLPYADIMSAPDIRGQGETLELINSELGGRLDRQDESGSKIDTKATLLVGFAATAAQFLATRRAQPLLQGIAFAGYALAFCLGVWTLAVAPYKDIEPRRLLDGHAMLSKEDVLAHLAATRVKIFEMNKRKHDRKAIRWWLGIAALTIGLVFSAVSIVQNGNHGLSGRQGQHSAPAGRITARR
jgi:hypothetical protein